MEAIAEGYSEGIALDSFGYLSEGSGQNLFIVRDNTLYTPPLTASILPGITRNSVLTLAKDLGFRVREEMLPRELLYIADEAFFAGTAVEITPIRSVDRIAIGNGRYAHFRRDRRFAQVQVAFTAPKGVDPNPGRELKPGRGAAEPSSSAGRKSDRVRASAAATGAEPCG